MNTLKRACRSTFPLALACLSLALGMTSGVASAATTPEGCAEITDREARLDCFDGFFPAPAPLAADAASDSFDPVEERARLERQSEQNWFSITPHKPNYLLPVSHNFSSDFSQYPLLGPSFNDTEVKFQISLKTRVLPIDWRNSSLWIGYTQLSFWQLYADEEASSPFRETNHEPEIFWQIPVRFRFLGLDARLASFGFNHQSNGQPGELSRSWNRLTAQLVAERGNFAMTAKTWVRVADGIGQDDNPNIEDYMGRLQLGAAYRGEKSTFAVSLRNNLRSDNRSGVEVSWTFPLSRHLRGMVQLYSGYGENLIDMENYTNRASLGIALTDWL